MAARFSYFRGRAGGRNQRCPEAGGRGAHRAPHPVLRRSGAPPRAESDGGAGGRDAPYVSGGGERGTATSACPGPAGGSRLRAEPGALCSAPAVLWVVLTAALEGKEGAKRRG